MNATALRLTRNQIRILETIRTLAVASVAEVDAHLIDVPTRTIRAAVTKLERSGLVKMDHEAEYEARDSGGVVVSRWWAAMYVVTAPGRAALGES